MPEIRPIRSWFFRHLRWLAIAAVVVALPLLAYGGLQDCRGGRLAMAFQWGRDVEAKIELASSQQRVAIWGPAYRVHPERVFFPNEIGDSHFIVTVTNRRTGEVSTYEHG